MKKETVDEFKARGGIVKKVIYKAPQLVGIPRSFGIVKYKKARIADQERLSKESHDKKQPRT